MQSALVPVKEYHLSAEAMWIVFRNGDDESMTLEYNDQVFKGRSLYRGETEMGLVVSVELEAIPDLHTIFLSLVVPQANRLSTARSTGVSTFAVLSTRRTSIGGPGLVNGQLRTYQVVQLHGNAW